MTLDFSSQSHYLLALAPELLLCIVGMAVLLVGVWKERDDSPASSAESGWLALAGVMLAALANGWLYGVQEAGGAGMITVDRFRLFANWVFLLATGLSILLSFTYVWRQRLQSPEFYALMLFATAGMMLMAGTRDLIVIFLGLELMSIAVYVLAAFNRRDRRSAEAGLKYFLLGAFATGFLLYGIALVYGATGSTNIALIALSISAEASANPLLLVGILMLMIGFSFKVSAVPFHMWTPDVYEGAPSPVTAYMSVGVKAAAFTAFLRVFMGAFASVEGWYPVMWWLAVITMVAGNLIALVQPNVKRMLAYSSIAHAGYLLVALVALNETAAAGMLFYLLVYAVMNLGAFGVVIVVAEHGEQRLQIEDYAGFGMRQPLLGVLLTVFLLSLAGFPGTGGFMGKIFLLQGAAEEGLWKLAVVLVMSTIASYWYYLRVAWFMWMRKPDPEDEIGETFLPLPMKVALVAAAAIVLFLGVFPGASLEAAQAGAAGLSGGFGAFADLLP